MGTLRPNAMEERMRRRILTGIACLAAMIVSMPGTPDARGNRWGAGYFPDVSVITQDGKTLHFYDDLIKGRIVVVSFIYTSCSELCPIETARLAEVKDKLGDAVGRDIFFVSMTVDPEHDTPEMLKAYADAFDAKAPGWQFVTGGRTTSRRSMRSSATAARTRSLSEHRNEMLIGNDATGDWQRDSAFGDVDQLVMTIRLMDPEWRDQAGAGPGARGRLRLLSAQRPAGPGAVQARLRSLPHGRWRRRVGPDLPRGRRSPRPRLADRLHHRPAGVLARNDPTRSHSPRGFRACACLRWGLAKPTPRISSPTCGTKRRD